MHSLKPALWQSIFTAFLFVATAAGAGAQWTREAELSGSIFFGNSSQRLVATRAGVSHADSALELSLSGRYTYADIESEDGLRGVTRRSWDLSTGAGWHPFSRISPFIFGSVESSLEKQIDFRYGAGAGAKLTFVRDSIKEHSFSLSALAERTTPRTPTPDFDDNVLARWSARHGLKLKLGAAVTFSSTTFYKPLFEDFANYTISTVNSLGVALNSKLSLTLTLIDNYDSEARVRGAENNNDGQVLFGLKAAW